MWFDEHVIQAIFNSRFCEEVTRRIADNLDDNLDYVLIDMKRGKILADFMAYSGRIDIDFTLIFNLYAAISKTRVMKTLTRRRPKW